jgi:hypothetical protein
MGRFCFPLPEGFETPRFIDEEEKRFFQAST